MGVPSILPKLNRSNLKRGEVKGQAVGGLGGKGGDGNFLGKVGVGGDRRPESNRRLDAVHQGVGWEVDPELVGVQTVVVLLDGRLDGPDPEVQRQKGTRLRSRGARVAE